MRRLALLGVSDILAFLPFDRAGRIGAVAGEGWPQPELGTIGIAGRPAAAAPTAARALPTATYASSLEWITERNLDGDPNEGSKTRPE